MKADDFRKIALSFPETREQSHMDHPDFRVSGKIFATLGYPDNGWGMVKLTPAQQHFLVDTEPEVFVPAKGVWGKRGATSVLLRSTRKSIVSKALASAWYNTAPKSLARQFEFPSLAD
ncbi:MAG: MmcQ/YjbR family DNA-binding protein [Bacteroidota bacterium]